MIIMGHNIKQWLIELMADFLDSEDLKTEEDIMNLSDPVKREETELHIRMANAALKEYEKTVKCTHHNYQPYYNNVGEYSHKTCDDCNESFD